MGNSYINADQLSVTESALCGDTFREKAETASRLGFRYLEMTVGETNDEILRFDWAEEDVLDYFSVCIRSGMVVPSMLLSAFNRFPIYSADPRRRMYGAELLRRAFRFAERLGIKIVRLPQERFEPGVARDEANTFYMAGFCEAAEAASGHLTLIGCPVDTSSSFFHPDRFCKLKDACSISSISAAPDLGMLFRNEPKPTQRNAFLMGIDTDVSSVIISDRDSAGAKAVVGDGVLDVRRMLEMLNELHYRGVIILDFPDNTPCEEIARGRQHVCDIINGFNKADPLSSFIHIQK